MEWMTVLSHAPIALLGVFCLLSGYVLGARRARAVKRRVLRDLNAQSQDLLETKSSLRSLKHHVSQQKRKDRLLKLTLKKLQQADAQCRQMSETLSQQNGKYHVDTSRLRLDAVKMRETAIKAVDIARRATDRLHQLEQASPAAQAIVASQPRPCATGEPVIQSDAIISGPNRDSAHLNQASEP